MKKRNAQSKLIFDIFNYIFLIATAFICILPLINVLAVSFSTKSAATAGYVKLWPVNFTLSSYEFVMGKPEFLRALVVSLKRVSLGFIVNILMCILIAYPLSKDKTSFRWRGIYAWYFIITMLFYGGLVPQYMTIRMLGLIDSIWVLVLHNAVPVFNMIILMNFFRELPREIEEAAYIDGAGHWKTLWSIYFPLSKPALATISLFIIVQHWNSWFDGLIFMNSAQNYPLQSYLQTVVIGANYSLISSINFKGLSEISDRTTKAAQVFLAAVPILMVYPFLQKFFMKGLVLGSVKG